MVFTSKLIEDAVTELARLPGIGRKTAVRMALQLLKMDVEKVDAFTGALSRMRHGICFCANCHNVSDEAVCALCANPARHNGQLCVVENIRDVMAIENTQQYNGRYHVLGGLIAPLEGVGPEQLHLHDVPARIQQEGITELIMALSPNIEGDTTVYYLSKLVRGLPVTLTTIARGIAFGGDLEYADELTLAKSIARRLPVDSYLDAP